MPDLATWLLVAVAWSVELTVLVSVWRTRLLVGELMAMVGPWLSMGDDDGEGGEPAKRAVRDKRGRIVRWETVPRGPTSGARLDPEELLGRVTPAQMQAMQSQGVPVAELFGKWQNGQLHREDILPYLPIIMRNLKAEFSPAGGGGGGGGGPETRSRYG